MARKEDKVVAKKRKWKQESIVDRYILWILMITLAILPLITRTKQFDFISPIISGSVLDTGIKSNVFTYYKFLFLIIVAIILIVMFLYKMLAENYSIAKSYLNIPLALLFVLILLSGVTSPYISLALQGQFNQYEGTITYLCYIGLLFIAANILYNEKMLKYLIYSLYPIAGINALLGVIYFYGYDLLNSSIIFDMLFPDNITRASIKAGAAFNSTLYNPNYVSGIGAVLMVIFLTKALFDQEMKQRVINVVFSVLSFAMILASLSTSGFITIVFVLPIIIITVLLGKNKKNAAITGVIALICFSLVFIAMNNRNQQVWNESIGFFTGLASTAQKVENYDKPNTDKTETNSSSSVQEEDGFNLPKSGSAPLSGRLYIWDKTVELIKERPILGYGLNSIGYFFNQDDQEKHSNLDSYTLIVDKPHNLYLDIAFGSGIFALLAFLGLIGIHLYKNIKIYIRGIDSEMKILLACIFIGWCAYLIQGFVNDSIIATAPIFWVLFGASVSVVNKVLDEKV